MQLSFTFTGGLIGFPGLVLPAFDKGDILSAKWIFFRELLLLIMCLLGLGV